MPGPIMTAGRYANTSGFDGLVVAPSILTFPPAPPERIIVSARPSRYNSFDGQASGTPMTTATTATGGDAFGAIQIATGGFAAYDTTAPYRGSSVGRFSSQATAGATYAEWGTSAAGLGGAASNSSHYVRLRLRAPSLPADTTGVPFLVIADSASAFQGDWRINSAGNLILRSGVGAVLATSTTAVAANTWVDVGCAILQYGGSGVGKLQLVIFDAAGNIAETLNGTADTLRSGGANKVQVGMLRSVAFHTIDIGEIAWNAGSYPTLPTNAPAVVEAGTTAYATANATTVTTASFIPADGSLLVAYCSMGNGAGASSSLGAVTDSLGGTWTRLAGEASATGGVAEIWARDIATGAAITVTYDPGGTGASGLDLIVKAYTGANPLSGQPGATAVNAGATAYATPITTTAAGSLVVGALGRASDAQTVVANTATALLGQVNGSGGDTAALFRAAALTMTPGVTSIGGSNAAAGVNRIALAEILPAPLSGSTLSLSGSAASTSAATGDLTMSAAMSGAAASTSAATGAVTGTLTISGAAAGTSAATGAATVLSTLAGTATSTSTAAGAVTTLAALVGSAASTSTASGAVTARAVLSGSAASTSAASGALIIPGGLSGSAASTSAATGAVTQTQALAGTAAGTSAAAGSLGRFSPLAGAAVSSSTAIGAVGLRTSLAGSASSTSSAAGDLIRVTPIGGAAASVSSATGDITITSGPQTYALNGSAASTSSAAGALTARGQLSSAASSSSAASGSLSTRSPLSGAAASTSAASGSATAMGALSGISVSTSAATGSLVLRATITGSAASVSSASGLLGVRLLIGGGAFSVSSAFGDLVLLGPDSGITIRPHAGTTARPGSGVTPRPTAGMTVRTASGITYRPNAGVTSRP